MKVTRATIVVGIVLYGFLWVLALHGASSLEAPLAIPPILAFLVAVGVSLNRFMGYTPKSPKFADPEPTPASIPESESGPAAPSSEPDAAAHDTAPPAVPGDAPTPSDD